MPHLKIAGNFKELSYGNRQGPGLKDCLSPIPHDYEKQILYYLQHGLVLAAAPGISYDVLANTRQIIGSPCVKTDGVWSWYEDLEYYVQKYHCRLPEEFIQYMQSRQWQPPHEGEIDLVELSLRERRQSE